MENDWPVVTVGELADSISDTHKFGKDKLIFLNTSDVLLGEILHGSYSSVSDWPGQAKKSIKRDDILFSEIRPANGRWAFVDIDADDYVVSTKLMVIRSRQNRVVPRFLYHFLTSGKTTRWLQHIAESRSGTFPQITFDQVAALELVLPPKSQQAAISSFLDGLERKITLNQRTNETLESMAKAIFKSWFVDFDPVRSRRVPSSLPEKLADLFPSNFATVNGTEIPSGWSLHPIGELAAIFGGSTPSTKNEAYWQGGTHCWATPKDLSALATPVLLRTERKITDSGLGQITSGVLPKGTVLMSSRAPIGYLAIAEVPVAINQGFIAMKASAGVSNLFLLRWAEWAHDLIVSRANGSTFLEISKSSFRPILVTTPPEQVMTAFDTLVRPLYGKIVCNELESRTLMEIRDTLLPRLMAGEVSIADTERIIGAQS